MHAVFTEVEIPKGAPVADAAEGLRANAVPAVRAAGAVQAYWLAPMPGRAVGVVLFEDEATASAAATHISVGGRPPGAPEGVRYRTVEVREVIAQL